jgi:tetratricopeptide (TPR) repeat protein
MNKTNNEDLFLEALNFFKLEQFKEVKVLLKKVVDSDPRHTPSVFLLAQVFEKEEDYSSSETYYRVVINKDPNFFDARFRLGNLLYKEKKYSEAVDVFKKALHLKSDDYQSFFMLGNCYRVLKLWDEAIKSYYKVLHYEPNFSAVHLNLANCLRTQGFSNDALFHFQKALKSDPNNFTAQRGFSSFAAEILEITLKNKPYETYLEVLSKIKEIIKNEQFLFRYLHTHLLMNEHWEEGFRVFLDRFSKYEREKKGVEVEPKKIKGSLKGKHILIVKEQGLGDLVFFLRFLRNIKNKGAFIYLLAAKEFLPLFESLGVFEDVKIDVKDFKMDFDRSILAGDLPYVVDLKNESKLPLPFPMVPPSEALMIVKKELEQLGSGPFIAINWGKSFENKKNNFVRQFCESIKDIPGTFISTQYNPKGEDLEICKEILPSFFDFSRYNKSLDRMLSLLFLVDDYFGVSNTNTHFRASFNKEFSVFVPFPNHWYWTQKNRNLLWHSKGKAYFQGANKSWESALKYFITERSK